MYFVCVCVLCLFATACVEAFFWLEGGRNLDASMRSCGWQFEACVVWWPQMTKVLPGMLLRLVGNLIQVTMEEMCAK